MFPKKIGQSTSGLRLVRSYMRIRLVSVITKMNPDTQADLGLLAFVAMALAGVAVIVSRV